jgi:hypothetical protein
MTVSRRAPLKFSQAELRFTIKLALGVVVNGGMQRPHTYSRRGYVILDNEATLWPNVPEKILVLWPHPRTSPQEPMTW